MVSNMDFLGSEFNSNKINILNISSGKPKPDDLVPALKKDQTPTVVGVAVKRSLRAARDDYELLQKFKLEADTTFANPHQQLRDDPNDNNNNEREMTDFQSICQVLKVLSKHSTTTSTVGCGRLKENECILDATEDDDEEEEDNSDDGHKRKVMETTICGGATVQNVNENDDDDNDVSFSVQTYNPFRVDNTTIQHPTLASIDEADEEVASLDLIDLGTTEPKKFAPHCDNSFAVDCLLLDDFDSDITDVATTPTTTRLPLSSSLERDVVNDKTKACAPINNDTHTLTSKAPFFVKHVRNGCATSGNESVFTTIQLEKHQQQSFPSSINNDDVYVQDTTTNSNGEKLLNNRFCTDISCSWSQVETDCVISLTVDSRKIDENFVAADTNSQIEGVASDLVKTTVGDFQEKLLDKRKLYQFSHTTATTTNSAAATSDVSGVVVVIGHNQERSSDSKIRHEHDNDEKQSVSNVKNSSEKLLSKRKFHTDLSPPPSDLRSSPLNVRVTLNAHISVDDLIVQKLNSCQSSASELLTTKKSVESKSSKDQSASDGPRAVEKSIIASVVDPDKEEWYQETSVATNKVDLSFLTKGTSQFFHPPVLVENSLLDTSSFEASNRLKRLEARFKGLAYTKKLLGTSSNNNASDVDCDVNKNTDPVNDCVDDDDDADLKSIVQQNKGCSLSTSVLRKYLLFDEPQPKSLETIEKNELLLSAIKLESAVAAAATVTNDKNNNVADGEVASTADSEEICTIVGQSIATTASPPVVETIDFDAILAGDVYTNCEFDVRQLCQYAPGYGRVFECYDELEEDLQVVSTSSRGVSGGREPLISDSSSSDGNESCDCSIEAVPLYFKTISSVVSATTGDASDPKMRETSASGTLRGLLKKPNRPPPTRKNRVVFDETRNEFFDADYIILIREDCPYDEEDEEPCTCGEHELVRICCDEGCNCGYTAADDGRTPPSPKFAPPIEFVDQATLSPPEGYKDGSSAALLDNALGGALGGHVFGAQHIQQLQVIQRLQQQRAAMLAAAQRPPSAQSSTGQPPASVVQMPAGLPQNLATVCTECAECAECAAKQLLDDECNSQCSEEISPMDVPHAIAIGALVPVQKPSPERRITQKEIVAGEERPKFLTIKQQSESQEGGMEKVRSSKNKSHKDKTNSKNQRLVVETITMTTVTEHRIVHETTIDGVTSASGTGTTSSTTTTTSVSGGNSNSNNSSSSTSTNVPHLSASVASATNSLLINRNKSSILNQNLSNNNNTNNNTSNSLQHQQQQQQQHNNNLINNNLISNNSSDKLQKQSSEGSLFSAKALSTSAAITGILKGGKLWTKTDQSALDDSTNTTSDEETSSKRSVRFTEESVERGGCDGGEGSADEKCHQPVDYVSHTLKRHHTSLFHNALRPNSAVRQLFPSHVHTATVPLTHEALRALEEAKKAAATAVPCQPTPAASVAGSTSGSTSPVSGELVAANPTTGCGKGTSDAETDTIKRTIERNALRRSLIKYEPKKKPPSRDATSLEERIRQLTCDIDEPVSGSNAQTNGIHSHADAQEYGEMERRDSPAGEENPQQPKYTHDKSFSPSSSASSSSSGSTGSTYRKITDLFNKERRQERIPEADENPIVIIPQDCRCPAGPDIGMGVQIQGGHTQVHQPPHAGRQNDSRRQFLSTLAPLTACVAGQRDDLSYYTLAHPGDRTSMASSQATEYSLGDIDAVLQHQEHEESKKVAPDVIAGTPGQEPDELVAFAQQEAPRTERLKKRYSAENPISAPASGNGSDDDEQNDYGFNRRPSVRGIKPRFGSTNEILQQMQAQLAQPTALQQKPLQVQTQQQTTTQTQIVHSQTLPRQNSTGGVVAAKQQITAHHQQTASWSYYPDVQQKPPPQGAGQVVDPQYYQLPPHSRHSFHGHEAVYQNCHTVSMQHVPQQAQHSHMQQPHIQQVQQQQYAAYARSPTRRPESPPPLRNYHQTMVLIPYNGDPYQQYDPENPYPRAPNVVEYQQVTQQTIRVPVGYPLPGMAVHLVAGRGMAQPPPHYATLPRLQGPPKPNYAYATMENGGVKFSERGVPEGAASSAPQNDCGNYKLMSPTGAMPTTQMGGGMQQPQQQQQQQSTMSSPPQQQPVQQPMQPQQQQGAVFYAMNV